MQKNLSKDEALAVISKIDEARNLVKVSIARHQEFDDADCQQILHELSDAKDAAMYVEKYWTNLELEEKKAKEAAEKAAKAAAEAEAAKAAAEKAAKEEAERASAEAQKAVETQK